MDPEYLQSCSYGMIQSIKEGDSDGVWLMETWVFINTHVWTEDYIQIVLIFRFLYQRCSCFFEWY